MIHKMYLLATAAGTLGLLLLASRSFSQVVANASVSQQTAVPDETIRVHFMSNFFRRSLGRPSSAYLGDTLARPGDRYRRIAGRSARDDAETRAILGHGL